MNVYLIADTHFNHNNINTYCQRPDNFTELLIRNWIQIVRPEDTIIHLGDVFLDKAEGWKVIWPQLVGNKILIRGNHDRKHSCTWWMENGFQFACDGLVFRNQWLTHEPATSRASGCELNIHGHLHNIWDGFHPNGSLDSNEDEWMRLKKQLKNPWQRLFAIEYTNYMPVEFDKFVFHPDRYQARGRV